MQPTPKQRFSVRIDPAYHKDEGSELSVDLGSFEAIDHPLPVGSAVGGLIRNKRPRPDLDGRVVISREDGTPFSETEIPVGDYVPDNEQSDYPRSSITL